MKLFLSFLRSVALLSACAVSVAAQVPVASAPVPTVRARLYFLSVDRAPVGGLALAQAKELTAILAPSEFVSQPVDYEGPATVVVAPRKDLAAVLAARGAGGAVKPPAPGTTTTLTLPAAENGEWLVLLGHKEGALQSMLVDFSPSALPEDGYLFWNLTARPLGVALGTTRSLVAAGQRQVMSVPEGADYLPLRVFENHDGEARQAFASRHLHRPGRRQLVLLSQGAEPGRVRLRMITQQVAKVRPDVAGTGPAPIAPR